jgi:hypothetical protein
MFALSRFDGVSPEFKNLKVVHLLVVFWGSFPGRLISLSQYEVANCNDR